ncbi:MAG: hypothetical protein H6672_20595 [Anaerolineaceae bacterium]|nr:hypothetical protein [Anaerolineaceae bacterium]
MQTESLTNHTLTNREANLNSIGIVLTSIALGAVGQLILKAAMNSLGASELSLDTLVTMATNPLLILGVGVFGFSTLLWLLALTKADLSFVYPFLSLIYVAVLIGGAAFFGEQITLPRVVGFAVIVTGVLIIARSEQKA